MEDGSLLERRVSAGVTVWYLKSAIPSEAWIILGFELGHNKTSGKNLDSCMLSR